LKDANIRAELDGSSHTLNYRIRHHQSQKVPYLLIVGEREAASEHVAVRLRTGQDLGPQPLSEVIARIQDRIATRSLEL
jgi:threonyl-tRNA synthetase